MTIMRRRAPEPYRPIGERHPVHVATRVECWRAHHELRQTKTELILWKIRAQHRATGLPIMEPIEVARWPLATVTIDEVRAALRRSVQEEAA